MQQCLPNHLYIINRFSSYNLDAIISVGYRVNSAKATKFRIWATNVLKEYIKKGFVMDDEREIPFNMEQFAASVNEFLEFRKYDILEGNGKISRNKKVARAKQMSNIGGIVKTLPKVAGILILKIRLLRKKKLLILLASFCRC